MTTHWDVPWTHGMWYAHEKGAVEALPAYDKPGRWPLTGQPPTVVRLTVRFRLSGALASVPQTREALLTRKSRFIVATNELDAHPLPPTELLAASAWKWNWMKASPGAMFNLPRLRNPLGKPYVTAFKNRVSSPPSYYFFKTNMA